MVSSSVRERLSPNVALPNSLVYTPIEDWNHDDVWLYLMQVKNPWGHDNKSLLGMYQGASEGGECPLVVDSSTPSCGSTQLATSAPRMPMTMLPISPKPAPRTIRPRNSQYRKLSFISIRTSFTVHGWATRRSTAPAWHWPTVRS